MRPTQEIERRGSETTITAQLEFTPGGYLKAILLNAQTDSEQATLERALTRIMNPGHLGWIGRLFRRDPGELQTRKKGDVAFLTEAST